MLTIGGLMSVLLFLLLSLSFVIIIPIDIVTHR